MKGFTTTVSHLHFALDSVLEKALKRLHKQSKSITIDDINPQITQQINQINNVILSFGPLEGHRGSKTRKIR